MFSISENALTQIKKQIAETKAENMALRFSAFFTKERTIQYNMGFDNNKEDDIQLNLGGIPILLDQPSSDIMEEAKLDYVKLESGDFQFIFINPLDPSQVAPKPD